MCRVNNARRRALGGARLVPFFQNRARPQKLARAGDTLAETSTRESIRSLALAGRGPRQLASASLLHRCDSVELVERSALRQAPR